MGCALQVEKVAEDFYSSKMTADGLQSYCKICYAQTSHGRRTREPKEHRDKPLTSLCALNPTPGNTLSWADAG